MIKILMKIIVGVAVLVGALFIEPVRGKVIDVRSKWASAEESFAYGSWYQLGRYVKPNREKALKYVRMAADNGHALSQHRLGWYYDTEFLGEPDIVKAVTWYEKSAAQGLAKSHRNLAGIYWGDDNGVLNHVKAIAHDKQASALGDVYSALSLGKLYQEGSNDIEIDHSLANYYLKQAMELGSANAAFRMGNQFWNGRGTETDLKMATILYFIAHRLGQSREAYTYAMQFQKPEDENRILMAANAYLLVELCPTLNRSDLCEVKT